MEFLQFACFGFLLISLKSLKAEEITVDSSHRFNSEHYPNTYPSNYNETWCFVTNSNSRLLLSFVEIEIEEMFDFIIVSESTASSGDRQLLRWSGSGNQSAPTVLSSTNNLCVYIQTDSAVNRKGFSGLIDAISDSFDDSCSGFDCNNGVCLGKYDRCNGFVNCGNGMDEICNTTIFVNSEVEFKSMYYDEGGYISNHHFTWYLTVNDGMRLELEFTDVDIEIDSPYDLILVGNGLDTSRNRLLNWHGGVNDSTRVRIHSTGSSLWVHFTCDESVNGRGFSATARSLNTQEGIQCEGDYFDCGNGVCIPRRKTCDGFQHCVDGEDEDNQCRSPCNTGETLCKDGKFCFLKESRCDGSPLCLKDDYQFGCELTVPVMDRETRLLLRNFSQTITFTTNIPEKHLLINLFFIRTESRNVEVNLTVGENELNSSPLLRRNGIVNDYVLTQRSSGQVLWLKFDVKGSLLISVNVLKEEYNLAPRQPSCPEDIFVENADETVEWRSPLCNDQEDGKLMSTCSPSSGDAFSDDKTIVSCTCTDSLNLISSCNFTVTVNKPGIVQVQVVPLIIGLTVVAVLIVLFAAFCFTSRIDKRKHEDQLLLNESRRPTDGYSNTNMQPEFNMELLTSTNPESGNGEGSRDQRPDYASIAETTPGGPENPDRHTVNNTFPKPIYSERVYDERGTPIQRGTPIPPERGLLSPGSSGVEQSPYYSRQFQSKHQD